MGWKVTVAIREETRTVTGKAASLERASSEVVSQQDVR